MASPAWAGAIVTWEAFGTITTSTSYGIEFTGRVPDPGTAYHLTMSFDPSSMVPTTFSPAGSNCFQVADVTGTMTMGSYDYALAGRGYTHSQMPGSPCQPGSQETSFQFGVRQPADSPWSMDQLSVMELWYVDELFRDGFPDAPTTGGLGGWQIHDAFGGPAYTVAAHGLDLRAVTDPGDPIDPAPVPEPGTLSLLGLGLAAAIRRKRLSL
jgi:hypothetical protein